MAGRINIDESTRTLLAPRYLNAPVEVSLTTSSAASTQLPLGLYLVQCTEDAFIRQGASGVAATANSWFVSANSIWPMRVEATAVDDYLAGILASGTATLQILKVTE